MRYATTVGVDLAKNVIQISVVSGRGKELCNRSLTRRKFAEAARRPNIREAPIKSVEQQGLQAILRARDRLIQV